MKSYPCIANFDGAKFATRYSLNSFRGDFNVIEGMLNVPDGLPDDPPIQETTEPVLENERDQAIDLVDSSAPVSKVERGTLLVAIDELNLHALKINAILDAVDAATSLADLKSRIASIPDYPQRTPAQAKQAVKNKISSGGAD